MKTYYKFIFGIICLFVVSPKLGLTQKLDTLKHAIIVSKIEQQKINSTITVDSNAKFIFMGANADNYLRNESNVAVKNYGVGSLASFSIRGSSSAQTKVLWNGVNINNSQLGITDISLLPMFFFDKMSITFGGNNAIGGSLNLDENKVVFEKDRANSIGISLESLGNASILFKTKVSDSTKFWSLKLISKLENNKFRFLSPLTKEIEYFTDAEQQFYGLVNALYFKHKSNMFSIHTWLQYNDRNIPATIYETISNKNETSFSLKNIFKYVTPKASFHLATLYDNMNYKDSIFSFYSLNRSLTLPIGASFILKAKKGNKLMVNAENRFASIIATNNYLNSFFLNLENEFFFKNCLMHFFVKKEYSNLYNLPFVYGVNFSYKIKQASFYINTTTNNRLPTLNELYFEPGGNKNLLPEFARNIEAGINNSISYKKLTFKNSFNTYARIVNNWILWNGSTIFTPSNVAEVYSRGLENNFRVELNTKNYTILNSILYAYTLSTVRSSKVHNDNTIGMQLPYAPRYMFKNILTYSRQKFTINYVYNYTGYRFITADNSYYLKPFSIHNIDGLYKHKDYYITCRLNNVLNIVYEGVSGRVMPTRNLAVGIIKNL